MKKKNEKKRKSSVQDKKRKSKSFFYYMSPAHLRTEINRCGYEYSVRKYIEFIAICYGGLIAFSFVFKLKLASILCLAVGISILLPSIFYLNFKNLYEAKKFEDITIYMEQMLYSFKKHPKILSSLQDTLILFQDEEESPLREAIEKAINHIQTGITEGSLYTEALSFIEEEYGCKRLYKIHSFLVQVEESGGDCGDAIGILLLDKNLWIDRIHELMQEKQKIRVNVAIAIALSLVIVGMTIYMLPQTFNIPDMLVSQIVTTITLYVDFLIWYVAQKILSKSLLDADKDTPVSEIKKSYDFVKRKDLGTYKTTFLVFGLLIAVAAVPVFFLTNIKIAILVALFGGMIMSQPGRKYKVCRKRIKKEVEKAFPDWLLNLSLQLQTDNVQVSIAKASIDAPFVLQEELQTFIEALDKNPNSMEPYVNFLKDYQIADISTAMKMLFSLSEQGSDDAQGQIHTLVERNIKMMNKAEKIRMEDQLMGVEFTMLLPMITGVVKMIADLGLLMMTLLGTLGQIM